MNRGLLLTLTEPPPAMEEEFNAGYDQEHLAERLAGTRALLLNSVVPGALQARRFRAGDGEEIVLSELSAPGAAPGIVYRLYQP